jgi:hypothetical protein
MNPSPRDITLEKELPHSLDAERSVLGAIMVQNSNLALVQEILKDSDFYRDQHRRIFLAMGALGERACAIDPVTTTEELQRRSELGAAGGPAYIDALIDGVPHSSNAAHYAQIVREKSMLRLVIAAGSDAIEAAYSSNGNGPGEVLQRAAERIRHASEALVPAASVLAADDLADVLDRPIPETPWAARGLIAQGDLGIISGPGGIGKSWISLALALDLAVGRDALGRFVVGRPYRIAVVDLESRPWEADQRLHRIVAGCGLDRSALRGMVHVVRHRLRFDRPGDVRRLIASVREWKIDFVILDSFRRLHAGDENRSETISGLFLDAFDLLRSETGAGAIVIDHHRKPTGENDLDGPENALRGSTDKRNMADWHVGIEGREEHLAFIPTKTRHSKLPDPFKLELAGLHEDAPFDGPVTIQYVGDLDRASDKVQDAITALLQEAGIAGMLRGEILGRSGYSTRATDQGLQALRTRNRVKSQPEGKQTRYRLAL